jgi:hypothetical protein
MRSAYAPNFLSKTVMTLGYLDYAAATVAIYLLGRWASKKRSHGAPLPPGPSGLPIIGSLLAWPKDQEWITFSKWAKQYGMCKLSLFSYTLF